MKKGANGHNGHKKFQEVRRRKRRVVKTKASRAFKTHGGLLIAQGHSKERPKEFHDHRTIVERPATSDPTPPYEFPAKWVDADSQRKRKRHISPQRRGVLSQVDIDWLRAIPDGGKGKLG